MVATNRSDSVAPGASTCSVSLAAGATPPRSLAPVLTLLLAPLSMRRRFDKFSIDPSEIIAGTHRKSSSSLPSSATGRRRGETAVLLVPALSDARARAPPRGLNGPLSRLGEALLLLPLRPRAIAIVLRLSCSPTLDRSDKPSLTYRFCCFWDPLIDELMRSVRPAHSAGLLGWLALFCCWVWLVAYSLRF